MLTDYLQRKETFGKTKNMMEGQSEIGCWKMRQEMGGNEANVAVG